MDRFFKAPMKIGGGTIFGRLAFGFLVACSIAIGAAIGVLFVYSSDLPEIHALEDYRPNVVTELYADDGQSIGTFALQRRILLTYGQIPKLLKDAILTTEDQHFEEHWGVDFPRVLEAAWHDVRHHGMKEGASTLTMQLAGGLFLNRADRSLHRKMQETILAIEIERHYTKEQIFTMYCNQIYLGAGNYGFEAASEYYFSRPVGQLTLPQAATLAAIIRGPIYSPIGHAERALARRNLVLSLMAHDRKITQAQAAEATKEPLGLHVSSTRNNFAPYFVEEIRQYLEHTYGTAAVHEQGLRVYTTLNVAMQKAAEQAVRDGLHTYDRRHGWRGNLPNILAPSTVTQNSLAQSALAQNSLSQNSLAPNSRVQSSSPQNSGAATLNAAASAKLDAYQNEDWRGSLAKGDYVPGLVMAVEPTFASIKIGQFHAMLTPADFAWTAKKTPPQLLKVGDLVVVLIKEVAGTTVRVELEQQPVAQAALLAIDNPTGEVKAMVGGYDFDQSKFNRATQAVRQTGSSFKVYVYATALEQGASPFDTIVDEPVTFRSGGQNYSPKNYDLKFEGRITLRRALADSRNVPAVRLLEHVGVQNTIDMARRFGITSPLPPYLPLALGSADLTLMEHTSAFTVFPDDGIHIEPHYIRRVTSYDGAVLEEPRPEVKDVVQPEVARTMTAMLEEVVQFGTGVRAKELGRVSAGKTGTTNDFTDAWYIGFTPHITAGVWFGNDDKRISLGKKETGARAALPIWLEFMQQAVEAYPAQDFQNVVPLEKEAGAHQVKVDTPDTAPPADAAEQGLAQTQSLAPSSAPAKSPGTPGAAPSQNTTKPLQKIAAPKGPEPVAEPKPN